MATQNLLMYCPADFASPALIRESVTKLRRAALPSTILPGQASLLKSRLALISNWASFCEPVVLGEDFRQDLHVPLFHIPELPLTKVISSCVIFRADKGGKIAVLVVAQQSSIDALRESGLVGQQAPVRI